MKNAVMLLMATVHVVTCIKYLWDIKHDKIILNELKLASSRWI